MLISLVRHGETDWNLARRIQGATDIPLNDTGRAQARRTAELLSRREWDAVVTSPLSRAVETGEIIAAHLGLPAPASRQNLVERSYGDAEGMNWDEVAARYPGDTPVPGRETRDEVAARIIPDLLSLAHEHPDSSVLVVTHGGAIRAVLAVVEPDVEHPAITNGSVHSFFVDEGALKLLAFDDPIELESHDPLADDLEQQNALEGR